MQWLNLAITAGVLIVSIALAWGKFGAMIAILKLRLDHMETNHLAHMQKSMEAVEKKVSAIHDWMIRSEEKIKKL